MLTREQIVDIINSQRVSPWSIQIPWEKTLTLPSDRKTEPRNFLYTREVGGSFVETYWAMQGIEVTNGFTNTARRKMEAGNLYEAIVVWVFKRCGLLKETQGKVRLLDDPRYLPVYGRLDIIAGHSGSWDVTADELMNELEQIEKMGFDFPFFPIVKRLSMSVIKYLSETYPDGNLEDTIYEVKSLNSNAFWKDDEPIGTPYEHHTKQLTFYQLHNIAGVRPGKFLYIDRDSMSVSELPNMIKMEVVDEMYDWMEKMAYYYRNQIEPARPELIIWDKRVHKYMFNWQIQRSSYKDKMLAGVDVISINEQVKKMNKEGKEKSLMKSAFKGEEKYGNKKYKMALKLMQERMPLDDVASKTGVNPAILLEYWEKVKQMGEPLF